MRYDDAITLHTGDEVVYHGRACRITSVSLHFIFPPYFRLFDAETGEAVEGETALSYRLMTGRGEQ
jgi:hypothetical protein